jgi:hypothetical protein
MRHWPAVVPIAWVDETEDAAAEMKTEAIVPGRASAVLDMDVSQLAVVIETQVADPDEPELMKSRVVALVALDPVTIQRAPFAYPISLPAGAAAAQLKIFPELADVKVVASSIWVPRL